MILPTLVDKVGYIPILRIEYKGSTLDLIVENLTRNLFLGVVSLEAHNFLMFWPYFAISEEGRHEFTLMKDVVFYFIDSGLADVIIGGECFSVSYLKKRLYCVDTSSLLCRRPSTPSQWTKTNPPSSKSKSNRQSRQPQILRPRIEVWFSVQGAPATHQETHSDGYWGFDHYGDGVCG